MLSPNSREQRPKRRKLGSQGKMAGGLSTAWRFFGQFRLPHVLIRLVRLTNKLRLLADTPEINYIDGVMH
ncbi:hypothetical protein AMC78_CH02877 [Rhizobium phaseoli]|nr:hypothetical protein AMC78_CH02877 [Rhizobium phaseoli]